MHAHAGWSQRERSQDAVDENARNGHTIFKYPSTRELDAMKNVVVVLADVVAAEKISMCSHLDDLVLVYLASWTRALCEVLEARQEDS